MASISPQTIDLLIVIIFEGLELLSKLAKGEKINPEDLKLEDWEATMKRLKENLTNK